MANCVESIINDKAELKRYINSVKSRDVSKGKLKEYENVKHTPNKISNPMLLALFTLKNGHNQNLREQYLSEADGKTTIKDIISGDKPIIPSFWKKIRGLKNIDPRNMTIFQDVKGKDNDDQIAALNAIQIGIAFHHLAGSVSTEFDLMNKYNITEDEYNQLMPKGEFIPGISATGTLSAIGKEILATQGIVLMPKKKKNGNKEWDEKQFEVEKVYADVGMKAVRLLQKSDFVTVESKDSENGYSPMIIDEDFRLPGGSRLTKSNLTEGIKIRFNMAKMLGVKDMSSVSEGDKRLIEKYFRKQTTLAENNLLESKYTILHTNTRAATYMHRLLIPTNSKGPDTSTDPKRNKKGDDVMVSKRMNDIQQQKMDGTMVIPTDLITMFDFIYDKMETSQMSFEEAAKALGVDDYKDMMGYSDDSDSTAATRASNMGKSLSKTSPIQEFFDNYAEFRNLPIHLQEEIKRNGRGHYMTTFMNPQTDKNFSRYIMQIPEYSIPAFSDGKMTDVFEHMLHGIQDQAGSRISIDDILGNSENEELDGLIAALDKVDRTKGKQTLIFIQKAFKKFDVPLAGSVWQKYDTIKAIHDVRSMLASNKNNTKAVFKSTFMPKPDGTASGALIMSMQMVGKNKSNQSLFEALGLSHDVKGTLNDAYDIVLKELTSLEEDSNDTPGELIKTINFLKSANVIKSIRDIAKFASMPVMYSQSEKGAILTIAKDITELTYNSLESDRTNYKLAEEIKSWIQVSDEYFYDEIKGLKGKELVKKLLHTDSSKQTFDGINSYMQEFVTAPLYQIVNGSFIGEFMQEHNDTTHSIFAEMEALNKEESSRISLLPPEVIMAETIKKNGGKFDINNFVPLTHAEKVKIKGTNKDGKPGDRGIPLMKLFGVVNHPELNATVSRWEFAHEISARVNIVHAIDFAILNEAFARTFAEVEMSKSDKDSILGQVDLIANGTVSIHDAIAAHPAFSLAFTKHYQESARDINAVYDIHEELTFEMTMQPSYKADKAAKNGKPLSEMITAAETAAKNKTDELKKLDFKKKNKNGEEIGSKVFGFKTQVYSELQFGKPIRSVKSTKKADDFHEESNREFDNNDMLTKYVTKKEGARAHKYVLEAKESGKPMAIFDTETTGMDHTYTKELDVNGVVGSMPYQVAFSIYDPETGKWEDTQVWFHTEKVSNGIENNFWNNKKSPVLTPDGDIMSVNYINSKAEEDGLTNEEKIALIEKKLGKNMPLLAYNSDFDMEALNHMYKHGGNKRTTSRVSRDISAAAAHQNYMDNGKTRSDGAPLGLVYTEITKEAPKNAHDAMADVSMTKDVFGVIKPVRSKPQPTESTSNKYTVPKETDTQTPGYTQIKVPGGHVTYDFNPGNPSAPSVTDPLVRKVGSYKDKNMEYDRVEISLDNGKTWETHQKNGTPFHITRFVKAPLKPFETGKHALANPTFKRKEETPYRGKTETIMFNKKTTKSAATKKLEKYKNNPIVKEFLDNNNMDEVLEEGEDFSYTPEDKVIVASEDRAHMLGLSEEEAVAHEIVHFSTAAYINSAPGKKDNNVKYLKVVANLLGKKGFMDFIENDGSKGAERLEYALTRPSKIEQIAELEAILIAEPQAAEEIYAIIDKYTNKNTGSKMKTAVVRLWNEIKKRISRVSSQDVIDKNLDSQLLKKAVHGIMAAGIKRNDSVTRNTKKRDIKDYGTLDAGQTRSQGRSKVQEALKYDQNADSSYVGSDPISSMIRESNSLVADLLYEHFGEKAQSIAKLGAKAVDKKLSEVSSIYRDMRKTTTDVWDSETMQEIKNYLVPSSLKQRDIMHKMARIFQKANQNHGKITSTEITKLDNMMSGMSKDDVIKLNDMFALAPIFGLVRHDGILFDIADGTTSINKEISRLEGIAPKDDVETAKNFANLYMDGEATGDYYNIYQEGTTSSRIANVEQLSALYSLQKVKSAQDILMDIRENRSELFEKLAQTSLALHRTTLDAYDESGDKKKFRGNMTLEYYDEPFQMQVVAEEDMKNGSFDVGNEWEVLIEPEDNHGYAVMARKTGDTQFQEGFGTNIDYGNTDTFMPKGFKPKGKMQNLIKFGTGKDTTYKVVIPMSAKKKLGLIQNPAHTLLRSYAHIEKIRETQAIRDEIVENQNLKALIRKDNKQDLDAAIKFSTERGKDEPWFITLEKGVTYSSLPAEVKQRFKPIPAKLSNVKGFGSDISLVRKDISPWIVGYKRALPFANNPQLKKAFEIVTQAISLMKIHMIIVNPAKVTLDAISTTTLLMSYGVSPVTIINGWRKNIKQMSSMSKLKAQQVDLTIQARGGSKSAENKLKIVEKKLASHPLMGAMNAGVMQSLTTDIISRDYDTITGLQRNIDKVFNKLTHDNTTGEANNIHKAVVAFSKFGWNVEDLFGKLAGMIDKEGNFGPIAEELSIMGERIGKIKKDEDVAKYLSEFFASPSSTLTRLGSVATTYPDAMSRIIYRDHIIANWNKLGVEYAKSMHENGSLSTESYESIKKRGPSIKTEADMNDEEIALLNQMVSDFMPDYTFAPPMVLDGTGRFFITPFVSYSARIQRVILNLARHNPLTFFGSLFLAEAFGLEPGHTPYHIVGSNYITKEEFINNVFSDLIGVGTILPTNVLNFDVIQ